MQGKGDALKFEAVDWYELLSQGDRMQSLIDGHWEIMGESDHDHSVKLVVDEWGSWYRPGGEATPGDQSEQIPTHARCGVQRDDSGHFQSQPGKNRNGQLRATRSTA